jgi:hypothetical protein
MTHKSGEVLMEYLSKWKLWLPILILIAGSFGVGLAVSDTDGDGTPDQVTIKRQIKTIDPPGKIGPIKVDTDNQVQPAEQQQVKNTAPLPVPASNVPDIHEDMRDETPPGVTQAEVDKGLEKTEALAEARLVAPKPPAGAQAYSCPNKLVRNRSALKGPRVGTALHFTVSPWGSMDVIRGLFDTLDFGASSNKIIEVNGKCYTLVPDGEKAWAQGAANSAYFSIEIVTNDLSRSQWLRTPLIKRGILAALVRDLNRSVGAPLKLVDPVDCTWTPGVTDHDRLECGNTHWDVGKNFPWDVFMKQVRAGFKLPNARDRRTCSKVRDYRQAKRWKVASTRKYQATRLKYIERRGFRCSLGKPVAR